MPIFGTKCKFLDSSLLYSLILFRDSWLILFSNSSNEMKQPSSQSKIVFFSLTKLYLLVILSRSDWDILSVCGIALITVRGISVRLSPKWVSWSSDTDVESSHEWWSCAEWQRWWRWWWWDWDWGYSVSVTMPEILSLFIVEFGLYIASEWSLKRD